jgi:hypothetical protein
MHLEQDKPSLELLKKMITFLMKEHGWSDTQVNSLNDCIKLIDEKKAINFTEQKDRASTPSDDRKDYL